MDVFNILYEPHDIEFIDHRRSFVAHLLLM
jgi:hypothetical protein